MRCVGPIDWICDSVMTINLKFNYEPMYLMVQKESRDSRSVVLICNTSGGLGLGRERAKRSVLSRL